jgi:hypothetical protein
MKLIIAGSRSFNSYDLLELKVDEFWRTRYRPIKEIVSGGAQGADRLGESFARTWGIPIKLFKADWEQYGKFAGIARNRQMAQYATHCLCFWDGISKGTANMIELAKEYRLDLEVVRFTIQISQTKNL